MCFLLRDVLHLVSVCRACAFTRMLLHPSKAASTQRSHSPHAIQLHYDSQATSTWQTSERLHPGPSSKGVAPGLEGPQGLQQQRMGADRPALLASSSTRSSSRLVAGVAA